MSISTIYYPNKMLTYVSDRLCYITNYTPFYSPVFEGCQSMYLNQKGYVCLVEVSIFVEMHFTSEPCGSVIYRALYTIN